MSDTTDFQTPLGNLTVDGNYPAASPWYGHQGGRVVFAVQGDFGGGTAALQFSLDDGTTWSSTGSTTSLTADGGAGAELPPCKVRVNLSSSTSPNLDVVIAHTGGDRMSG